MKRGVIALGMIVGTAALAAASQESPPPAVVTFESKVTNPSGSHVPGRNWNYEDSNRTPKLIEEDLSSPHRSNYKNHQL